MWLWDSQQSATDKKSTRLAYEYVCPWNKASFIEKLVDVPKPSLKIIRFTGDHKWQNSDLVAQRVGKNGRYVYYHLIQYSEGFEFITSSISSTCKVKRYNSISAFEQTSQDRRAQTQWQRRTKQSYSSSERIQRHNVRLLSTVRIIWFCVSGRMDKGCSCEEIPTGLCGKT